MSALKCLSFLVAALAIAAYAVYRPLPPCFARLPTEAHLVVHTFRLANAVGGLMEKLGITNQEQILRSLMTLAVVQKDTDTLKSEDTDFDGVKVRVYTPAKRAPKSAALLYLHGGGWVLGNPDVSDNLTRVLADRLNILVASVDYRLAPEWRYPAAIDDVERAFRYLVKHAARFDIDPSRIAVGGESAGGNLAAALAVRLRDAASKAKEGDQLQKAQAKLQILLYPVLQGVNFSTVSMLQHLNDFLLPRTGMMRFVLQYALGMDYYNSTLRSLAERYLDEGCFRTKYANFEHVFTANPKKGDIRQRALTDTDRSFLASIQEGTREYELLHPTCTIVEKAVLNELDGRLHVLFEPSFSPLLSDSLTNLPPAYVVSCGHDVLCDEALQYVERLRDAGVFVEHSHQPDECHGYYNFNVDKNSAHLLETIAKHSLL